MAITFFLKKKAVAARKCLYFMKLAAEDGSCSQMVAMVYLVKLFFTQTSPMDSDTCYLRS